MKRPMFTKSQKDGSPSDLETFSSKRIRTDPLDETKMNNRELERSHNLKYQAVAQPSDSKDQSSLTRPMSKRLQKELVDLQNSDLKAIGEIHVDDGNLLVWNALIVPTQPPFSNGAFRVELNFPVEYPFKPPRLTFKTKIYHPNFDEKGQICLSIVNPENWKPATRVNQVMEALVHLIHEPEPEHPLRVDLAAEYVINRRKFIKNAEEHTKKFADRKTAKIPTRS